MTESNSGILFFSLFLVLLLIVLCAILRSCLVFANRYCVCVKWGKCCCYFRMDWEAHRRERDSLHRLRELRHRHREVVFGYNLSTYSQIPGAIPDSFNFGFILVPTEAPHRPLREQLTSEQRRRILENILVCQPYTAERNTEAGQDVEANNDRQGVATLDSSTAQEQQEQAVPRANASTTPQSGEEQQENEPTSIAIPCHEEPVDDNTCAICLDAFMEGELINDSTECQHFFHKECLLGWLDQHDVCPCCRRTMATEQDWKRAMEEEHIRVQEHVRRAVTPAN